jgi:hypothetical protein
MIVYSPQFIGQKLPSSGHSHLPRCSGPTINKNVIPIQPGAPLGASISSMAILTYLQPLDDLLFWITWAKKFHGKAAAWLRPFKITLSSSIWWCTCILITYSFRRPKIFHPQKTPIYINEPSGTLIWWLNYDIFSRWLINASLSPE